MIEVRPITPEAIDALLPRLRPVDRLELDCMMPDNQRAGLIGMAERALELMRRHDTLGATLALAEDYGRSAQRALDLFPQGPERQALSDIIRFCIARAR